MKVEVKTENAAQYRNALLVARNEEFLNSDDAVDMTFPNWLQREYGLKMLKNDDGYYTMSYEIVEPKRFMVFQIKHYSA